MALAENTTATVPALERPAPTASVPAPAPTSAPTQSDPPSTKKTTPYQADAIHEIPQEVDPLLVQILSWPRRHTSHQELQFCKFLREHIKAMGVEPAILAEGCIMVTVPRPKPAVGPVPAPSTTLFSCHIDTVEGHGSDAPSVSDGVVDVLRKKLTYDPNFGLIALDKDSIGGSLGADDGAGVWLMLKMIERKVPGSYIFHRGEEVGGVGSKAMVEKYPEILKQFECAVAFDRHDTYEVIYMQGGSKCASMKFTEALCKRLNAKGMTYQPSSKGVFTDTKNYRRLIPECVNVAVGYESQHGRNETLDFSHLAALLEACCGLDWDSLPIDRDPKESDAWEGYGRGSGRWGNEGYGSGSYGSYVRGAYPDFEDEPAKGKKGKKKGGKKVAGPQAQLPLMSVSEELSQFSLEEIEDWAFNHPEDAAKTIGQLLVEIATLRASNEAAMNLLGWKESK